MIENHMAAISDDFLATDFHAECSCGWVGENVRQPGERGPRAAWDRLAMADFAAHVHVADGLATEDDDV
jgi:hypothetical protein